MIKELQMCKSGYSEMLEMYLRQIFIRLQRHFEQTIITDTSQIAEEIDKAIVYFSEHYNEAINVDAYAKQNHVSTNWFIRNFKMYTGTTPKQFILQKRINNAETLLQNKQYNIKEIAQIIGYDNPLYFSRIFQRMKGISPSEYRKNIKKIKKEELISHIYQFFLLLCKFCPPFIFIWQVIFHFTFYNDLVNRKEINFYEKQIPQLCSTTT